MPSRPSNKLQTFPNPNPDRDYRIHMEIPEFSCLCPMTGQPDFATLLLDYVPDKTCVELKSLKLYVWSYRDQGAYHEAVTNRILGDLVAAMRPRFARLTARFNVRGGIFTTVVVDHTKRGWRPAPLVSLDTFPPASPRSGS
jgi:7-cyano-7-deazaguanine reductase